MERKNGTSEKIVREEEENETVLKKRILKHPLYGLMIETHLECLQVSGAEVKNIRTDEANETNLAGGNQPDLDHFMEAYCAALHELKEAIEKSTTDTTAFINRMYFELGRLKSTLPSAVTADADQSCQITNRDQTRQKTHNKGLPRFRGRKGIMEKMGMLKLNH